MIALSNHIKVLNVCGKGTVLWPREVTPNQAHKLCTVTFGTEYIYTTQNITRANVWFCVVQKIAWGCQTYIFFAL